MKLPYFTLEEAKRVGEILGVTWEHFTPEQFLIGMNTELEHGRINPITDVTHNDPVLTGKIALAHLNEYPDYYDRLNTLEEQAHIYWQTKGRV